MFVAIISRSRAARVTALVIVFVSALSAWLVYHYGEAGYDRVISMADDAGGKWLGEHQRRAEKLIYVFYTVAGLAAAAIAAEATFRRAAVPLALMTLLAAAGDLGAGGYIAHAGGRTHHKEFRYEPPLVNADEEQHDAK